MWTFGSNALSNLSSACDTDLQGRLMGRITYWICPQKNRTSTSVPLFVQHKPLPILATSRFRQHASERSTALPSCRLASWVQEIAPDCPEMVFKMRR